MKVLAQLLDAAGQNHGTAAADLICQACTTLRGVEAAAISLLYDGTKIGTVGSSSPEARTYDELQFTHGEGPCLESVARRAPVAITDLNRPVEHQWAAYGPALLALRIRGVAAMPIVVAGEYVGALDLFRIEPGCLNDDEMTAALMAADLAAQPVLDLLDEDLHAAADNSDRTTWGELNRVARAEIEQASGMLIAQLNVGPSRALTRLRAHAYASGASATEVARDVIDSRIRLEVN